MCLSPLVVKLKTKNETASVPCGKCPKCLARRVSAWSFRLMQEGKNATSALFVTITYDTKHIPISENGFMTLNKRDMQLFMKRLRKEHNGPSLKYYLCGEYGGKTKRPHYHIILFNAELEKIDKAWNRGAIHYGDVSGASIGYTLKYISKDKKIPMHKNDDRVPEFSLMSKGLGSDYLSNEIVWYHLDDP